MTQVKIQAGATFETTSPKEVSELTRTAYSEAFQELAMGVKPMRFEATGTISGAAVTIPQPQDGQLALGPSQGFVWRIDRVSVFGLGSGDVLQVHRTVSDGTAFLGNLTAVNGYLNVPESPLLYGGEFLIATGTGLTATGQLVLNGEGVEVPAFALWKLTS